MIVVQVRSYAAEKKNIDLRRGIHASIERNVVIMGDPGRLRHVLTNLPSKSIKFASEGFVKVAIAVVEENNDQVRLSTFEDTGIGFGRECAKRAV